MYSNLLKQLNFAGHCVNVRVDVCWDFVCDFQEMERREKELEATIRQPAKAEKYRMEKIAEAKRNKVILEAEAEAEAVRVGTA